MSKYLHTVLVIVCLSRMGSAHASEVTLPEVSDFKTHLLLQSWLVNDTATPQATNPNFFARRAEIGFKGNFGDDASFYVMGDLAKLIATSTGISGTVTGANNKFTSTSSVGQATQDGRVLQDLLVSYRIIPELTLTVGQFKLIATEEGLQPSSELLLPERSVVGRNFGGDRREPGAKLVYKMDAFQAGLMVSNGYGPNTSDIDSSKRMTGRVDYVLSDNLKFGAFTTANNFSYGSQGAFGANLNVHFGDFLLTGEGALGTDTLTGAGSSIFATGSGNTASQVGTNVNQSGFQFTAAYSLLPKWQPVLRYATFTPDTTQPSSIQIYEFGLNYYVVGNNAKIQAAVEYTQNNLFSGLRDTYQDGVSGCIGILSFQAALN